VKRVTTILHGNGVPSRGCANVHVSMSALRRHVVNISGERRDLFPVPYSLCNKYVLCTALKYMYAFLFIVDFTYEHSIMYLKTLITLCSPTTVANDENQI
jgi:hypothetical protein